jgi:VWFA-related protein
VDNSSHNIAARPISRRGMLFSMLALFRANAQDTTFSTDVKVVNVLATVRNNQGQIVQNLKQDDFTLQEDGRAQTIRYFSKETDLPLTLGLLIDTSMSQRRVLGQERTASYRFLDQVLREDKDMAFVLHFDREVELLQDLTSSRKRLETAFTDLETAQPAQRGGGGGG